MYIGTFCLVSVCAASVSSVSSQHPNPSHVAPPATLHATMLHSPPRHTHAVRFQNAFTHLVLLIALYTCIILAVPPSDLFVEIFFGLFAVFSTLSEATTIYGKDSGGRGRKYQNVLDATWVVGNSSTAVHNGSLPLDLMSTMARASAALSMAGDAFAAVDSAEAFISQLLSQHWPLLLAVLRLRDLRRVFVKERILAVKQSDTKTTGSRKRHRYTSDKGASKVSLRQMEKCFHTIFYEWIY